MCNHALRDRHMLKYAREVIPDLEISEPEPEFTPHAYPKSPSPIVVEENGRRVVQLLRWGIAHTIQGKPTFTTNARDDRLLKIALWREPVARRRCLIPLVGYFEPGQGPVGAKGELFFTIKARPAFFVAGLWDFDPDGTTRGYAMVTTSPNSYTAPFHDRQPVVLSDSHALQWLGSQSLLPDLVLSLTQPPPSEIMQHEVIPAVPKLKVEKPMPSSPSGEVQQTLF